LKRSDGAKTTLAAAELLRRVSHGDIAEMGLLLTQAVPPVAPSGMLVPGPELTGRVVTYRWPTGGPLGSCSARQANNLSPGRTMPIPKPASGAANQLNTNGSRGGRPAKYWSGACRTAAHRALHRTAPETAAR
jgi:hypothetical protein